MAHPIWGIALCIRTIMWCMWSCILCMPGPSQKVPIWHIQNGSHGHKTRGWLASSPKFYNSDIQALQKSYQNIIETNRHLHLGNLIPKHSAWIFLDLQMIQWIPGFLSSTPGVCSLGIQQPMTIGIRWCKFDGIGRGIMRKPGVVAMNLCDLGWSC